jgi:O-antigen/teichoic acid export membrane protein
MSVKRNIAANYLGRGWVAINGFLFIPLYIHFLGVEAYGVIGFFASMMAVLAFLDFGMSQTLVRETARCGNAEEDRNDLQSLVGTLEYVYWSISISVVLTFLFLAPFIASNWLQSTSIPTSELASVISIMGMVAGLRWAAGIYRSGLIGLQEQVWLNIFESVFATLRGLGVVAVLAWYSQTIIAFFVYQGLLSIVEVFLLRRKLWMFLAGTQFTLPRFHFNQLRRVWRFAGGVALISILGALISQLDKLILPGLVPLEVFAYYMVASALGRSIAQLVFPVATAFRPVFARLVAQGNEGALSREYHKASQIMGVSTIPLAIVLAVFSSEVLWLWTGNNELRENSAMIVSLLALGTMFNGLVNILYSIQLAYGWLRMAFTINLISAIILVPSFMIGVEAFGVVAAGWVWLALNLSYVLINVSVMHKRYLKGEASAWYFKDILPIILTSGLAAIIMKAALPLQDTRLGMGVELILVTSGVFLIAIISVPYPRDYIFDLVRRKIGLKWQK